MYLRDAMAETMRVENEAAKVSGAQSMSPCVHHGYGLLFYPEGHKSLWEVLIKNMAWSALHKSKSISNLDNKLGKGEHGSRSATKETPGEVNKREKGPRRARKWALNWSKGLSEMFL